MGSRCYCMILNYNDSETVIKLVNEIKNFLIFDKIIVVDNCSNDNSMKNLIKIKNPIIDIIQTDFNGGYGYGNNYGIKYIQKKYGDGYILISNPDVIFTEEMVENLLQEFYSDNNVAVSTAVQLDINRKRIKDIAWRVPNSFEYAILNSGKFSKYFETNYNFDDKTKKAYVDCVPGALLMVDSNKFLSVGGYDEEMFLFGEETTIGYKLKQKKYKTVLLLNDNYIHEHSVSINKSISKKRKQLEILYKSRNLFMQKYLRSHPLYILLAKYFQNRALKKLG
ncbi:glycosyltransferase family 2 protein [Enterococcus cecorum]|uniref:glycosyltransferase n=3 Tax=Enterococcus cecorum TaxID=44008 RepID=UPI001FAC81A3|nr:glycosyltransferase family 2 protein [Enterococcus cecorum]MCJ0544677.1 glycosyltransferase family 2 protein [Enterococcus cecorum]MCJ0563419.1 glycosyltransferase family 2 protein [Enterococcus cecorum]